MCVCDVHGAVPWYANCQRYDRHVRSDQSLFALPMCQVDSASLRQSPNGQEVAKPITEVYERTVEVPQNLYLDCPQEYS